MFTKVVVANRGEIALRVMRACKELGLTTVAVYSEVDREALHVRYADEAYLIGPAPAVESYLRGDRIIDVALRAGAGAIHPGYGFLSENAAFARACADAGLIFIGPPAEAMEAMGGKVAARRIAQQAGVRTVPGTLSPVETVEEVLRLGEQFGYPLAIKASAGGGGRGLKVVRAPEEVQAAFESARREAEAAFKSGELYVEKYLADPRHIEIQVLADQHGNVLFLGERDCSVQRRHQKLIEEGPSPVLTPELRAEMGAAAVRLARSVGYCSAGTLEFLFQDGEFYFLEMNTRIQVEHPVTELITGIDLVTAQIRIARGEPLPWRQEQIQIRGHAIECRINAEDPVQNFRPASGVITAYREPAGFGVRVDSGVYEGYTVPQHYDSLLAKLICWGQNRDEALARMRRALADYTIEGLPTTIPFHRMALDEPAFVRGEATVNFIPRYLGERLKELAGTAPAAGNGQKPAPPAREFDVEVNGRRFSVRVSGFGLLHSSAAPAPQAPARTPRRPSASPQALQVDTNAILSPIQGTVVAVKAQPGCEVQAGEVLFIVEAMKMENEITAPRSGVIAEVRASPGATIEAGGVLASFAP